ncbi:helicase-related protein, partial [Pseudomonas aeruginosa]|uniref:helicase-related protein n=1 Tax=Pseudomonas aeruginosa TaxID=287 RepID=UPI0023590FE4
ALSRNDGKIKMLLVHPQSAGHGLNLQRGGRHIAFFDIPWSLELYLQLIGRLARQGQKYVVYVHHLVAKGTLDEAVMQCLLEKRNGQEELFKMLKALRRRSRIHKKL